MARKKGSRNPEHYKKYAQSKTAEHNKLKRVQESNGQAAAVQYAKKNGIATPATKAN